MTHAERIRIFVARPGDVQEEREALGPVVNELNHTLAALAPHKPAFVELLGWETHAYPEFGRPQGVINAQIGRYDIFVGIMWSRFGTPTGVAGSGTEEEFNRAFERWQSEGRPHLMFYFCRKPLAFSTTADHEQHGKVMDFRTKLSAQGLVWDYPEHEAFKDIVRPHLISVLGRMLGRQTPAAVADRIQAFSPNTEVVSRQITKLAQEYQQTRHDMPSGPERTRKMELTMTSMRTLAPTAYPLLRPLSESKEPGERLAAIAILQSIPKSEYFDWLAARLDRSTEKPFVGYHAAVALLTATRTVRKADRKALESAIARAKALLGPSMADGDRYRVLGDAERELNKTPLAELPA
jgi:hypothetical protein